MCDNQLTDLSALSGLTNLQSLDLGENQLTNITEISRHTRIETLLKDVYNEKDHTEIGR